MRPAAEPAPDLDDDPPPRFTENDPVELGEDYDDAGLGSEPEFQRVQISAEFQPTLIARSLQLQSLICRSALCSASLSVCELAHGHARRGGLQRPVNLSTARNCGSVLSSEHASQTV